MAGSRLIDRDVFDWGVRLTARSFKETERQVCVIYSEIGNYKGRRGGQVNIGFPAAARLRLLDAQTRIEAISAIVAESKIVQAELRTAATSTTSKKKKR